MKKKLFLCFRPIAVKIETESVGPDSFDDQISSAPTTPAKSRSPKTCFLKKSPVSAVERSRFSEKEIPEKKRGRRKSFSGFALSEISLVSQSPNFISYGLCIFIDTCLFAKISESIFWDPFFFHRNFWDSDFEKSALKPAVQCLLQIFGNNF